MNDKITVPFMVDSDEKLRSEATLPVERSWSAASFDHLVGVGEQLRRHVEAERLGALENDHKLDFGGDVLPQIPGNRFVV